MSITLTQLNQGVQNAGEFMLNKSTANQGNLKTRLYVNNHTPVVTDTISAYTACTATGYADVTNTGTSWTGTVSAGVLDYTYPTITFTFTAGLGQTVYGVVLLDASGNAVMAGLLDTPFAIPAGGGSLTLALEYQQKQC